MSVHTDVGAYALGLLDPRDREEFERHLADCLACHAELAELAGLRELLADLEPVAEPGGEPDQQRVADLLRARSSAQRGRARVRLGLSLAAAIALLAGGVGIGIVTRPAQQAGPLIFGVTHSATSPVTGVKGVVGLAAKAWGTQVTLDLSRVTGPRECQLVAVSRTGERRVVIGWFVPVAGYGVPGHPGHLIIQGGTSIHLADLAALDVTVVHGGTLVTILV